jgi:hypothetical protein
MLKISWEFSIRYGLAFSTLADEQDYAPFDPSSRDLAPYLGGGAQMIEEDAGEQRELGIVRAWLEFLIASTHDDIYALRVGRAASIPDIVLPHPGVGALPLDEWHHILQWMRHRLFGLGPMTDDEKAKAKREVTFVDETLADFRTRMRAEGRLDPS